MWRRRNDGSFKHSRGATHTTTRDTGAQDIQQQVARSCRTSWLDAFATSIHPQYPSIFSHIQHLFYLSPDSQAHLAPLQQAVSHNDARRDTNSRIPTNTKCQQFVQRESQSHRHTRLDHPKQLRHSEPIQHHSRICPLQPVPRHQETKPNPLLNQHDFTPRPPFIPTTTSPNPLRQVHHPPDLILHPPHLLSLPKPCNSQYLGHPCTQ